MRKWTESCYIETNVHFDTFFKSLSNSCYWVNRRRILGVFFENSDVWFIASSMTRKEIYAYLIIWEGVNDVPDHFDLQSPWPPSSLTSMDNGYRSSSLSYMVSLGFNYVVNKCASDKNQKESVWPFLYGLTSMVWLIDDQIDPCLFSKKSLPFWSSIIISEQFLFSY